MKYIYTIWLWFKNGFIAFLRGFASVIYFCSFAFMIFKALMFGAYCVFPILRPFVRNNAAFTFMMGRKLIEEMDEKDISLKTTFKYFILPYAVYLAVVVLMRRLVVYIFGG